MLGRLKPAVPEIRSKLFGLHLLEHICKGTGNKVLPYKVYANPESFSLSDFSNISGSRLIVRTDIKDTHGGHSDKQWDSMPRLNVDLSDKSGQAAHEKEIRGFMGKTLKMDEQTIFIVQKVPPLEEYDNGIIIKGDLMQMPDGEDPHGFVDILVNNFFVHGHKDTFRSNMHVSRRFSLTPKGRLNRELTPFHKEQLEADARMRKHGGNPHSFFDLAPPLQAKLFDMSDRMARYARAANTRSFEASCVTYKSRPQEPEYYDFLLGMH